MGDQKLYTFEFICLNLVSLFAFSNMAVFYSFFSYLERIAIPVEWRGFLLGLEPMAAFLLRLAIIPLLHLGNAAGVMLLALLMLVGALVSYGWAVTIPSLILLRLFHGAAFVLLVSSSMALLVHYIPKERSGAGFGFVSIAVLIPYAIVPPVTEALLPHVRSEADIYRGVTLLAIPAFVILLTLRKRIRSTLAGSGATMARRPTVEEIRLNLKESRVALLLAVNLLLYLCYASVFFFMKDHCLKMGITNVGRFFTISTLAMIALRLSGGVLFDKVNKVKALQVFMTLLVLCFILFGSIRSDGTLAFMAIFYGVCIGALLPLLNAALFVASPSHLRGLNTNLSLFMMDAGFFLSPYGGGLLLATGASAATLFTVCAVILTLSLVLLGRVPTPAPAGPPMQADL